MDQLARIAASEVMDRATALGHLEEASGMSSKASATLQSRKSGLPILPTLVQTRARRRGS
jgi:hypothetical protein